MRKHRPFWYQTDKKTNQYVIAIDLDEIVAINVPDITKPGCIITLRSGVTITMSQWDGDERDANIKFFLEYLSGEWTNGDWINIGEVSEFKIEPKKRD